MLKVCFLRLDLIANSVLVGCTWQGLHSGHRLQLSRCAVPIACGGTGFYSMTMSNVREGRLSERWPTAVCCRNVCTWMTLFQQIHNQNLLVGWLALRPLLTTEANPRKAWNLSDVVTHRPAFAYQAANLFLPA